MNGHKSESNASYSMYTALALPALPIEPSSAGPLATKKKKKRRAHEVDERLPGIEVCVAYLHSIRRKFGVHEDCSIERH